MELPRVLMMKFVWYIVGVLNADGYITGIHSIAINQGLCLFLNISHLSLFFVTNLLSYSIHLGIRRFGLAVPLLLGEKQQTRTPLEED